MKPKSIINHAAAALTALAMAACGGGGEEAARAERSDSSTKSSLQADEVKTIQAAAPQGGLPAGSSINVLWVGNSLTNTAPDYDDYAMGPMPERLKPMLKDLGITMTYQARIQGGAEFATHIANAGTMAEVGKTEYDIVNLQGYTEGFSSALAFQTAVKPLYDAAHAAGSQVLFEEMWAHSEPSEAPQYPKASEAVEAASKNMPGTQAIPVARVWEAVRVADPELHRKLYRDPTWTKDGTHQGRFGEYLNALVYARFFSGRSVRDIRSTPPQVLDGLSYEQYATLRKAVDETVTVFYQSPTASPRATLGISGADEGQVFSLGVPITLTAIARDAAAGDVSAEVQWRDESNALIGQGASLTVKPSIGAHALTARIASSDGTPVEIVRHFTVTAAPAGAPPVAHDKSISVARGSNFRQVDLAASAEAMGNPVVWSTLQLDKSKFKGVSAVVNATNASTVDLNYENGFLGADTVGWRVQDGAGRWSNWAGIAVTVTEAAPQSAVTVRASGSLASNVGPLMELRVNGSVVASAEVRASTYQNYSFTVPNVAPGAKVDVVFNNDFMNKAGDRNLFVESITLNGATIASNAPGVVFDRGPGAQAFDGKDVLPGLATLWWNGALRFTAPPATRPNAFGVGLSAPVKFAGYTGSYGLTTSQPAKCRAAWVPGVAYDVLYDDLASSPDGLTHTKTVVMASTSGGTVYAVCKANGSGATKEIAIPIK